ncbi:MAG: WecB/TagA/CpsF family glycosyltransferase [Planctomycetota bacterium]
MDCIAPPTIPSHPFERRAVMQAAVDLASPQQILDHLTTCAQERRGCSVVGISAPYATAMADNADLREAFLRANLLIPDGKGFTWGARMLGVPCGERLAIPDLCEQLLAAGDQREWKVFLYGATEEVNGLACQALRARFPGLARVEGRQGYDQGAAEEDALIEYLRNAEFNLLLVTRPSPDKEKFLARCCSQAGVVGVAAGGYADILAGKASRAPRLIQMLGCEWLYRVGQEPRRLWRRIGWANLRFAGAVLWRHLLTPTNHPWWGARSIQISLLMLVILAAYLPSLNAPYHFDDPEYIQRNPTIRSFDKLSEITVLAHRKLWWLSNSICYQLSKLYGNHQMDKPLLYGGSQIERPDVRIFRAWNIACHLLAALALFGLLRRGLRASGHISAPGTPYDLAAFGAAAIFAAHPLCTESVTYISGRDNGQGGMFYLLGLYAAAIAFERMGAHDPSCAGKMPAPQRDSCPCCGAGSQSSCAASAADSTIRWPRWFWPLIIAMIFGGCAVLTKESYLSWPGAVALVYFFFYRGTERRTVSFGLLFGILLSALALAWGANGRHDGYLGVAFELMLLFIILGALAGSSSGSVTTTWFGKARQFMQRRAHRSWAFILAVAGLGSASIVAFPYAYQRAFAALTGFQESSAIRSLCSQAHAVPWMLLRGIVPYGLNIDHDFPSFCDPNDQNVLAGIVIILVLLLFGLFGLYKRWLGAFGVLLALLSILPTNSIIERGDIVSERNFYLAAAGGACALAWVMALLTEWLATRIAVTPESKSNNIVTQASSPATKNIAAQWYEAGLWTGVLSCCVAGPFVSFTILRNNDWSDAYLLWDAASKRSPNKMRVLHNYGVACFTRGETLIKKSKAAEADAYFAKAAWSFNRAIKIGEEKASKGLFRPDEAVEVKCFHLAYRNLAAVYFRRYRANPEIGGVQAVNDIRKIMDDGLKRTAYDPDLAMAFTQFSLDLGNSSDAAPVLQQSLNLHDWADQLYLPLGRIYIDTGNFAQAAHYLKLAVGIKELHTVGVTIDLPREQRAETFVFLGLAQLNLNQRAEARESFRQSLECDPQAVVLLLTTTPQTRNPKLKPMYLDPPDILLIALSQTRRILVQTLLESLDDALKSSLKNNKTILDILRGAVASELTRRDQIQKKRREWGFTDDPDAEN